MFILVSIFVTVNAVLAFSGVQTLSEKIKSVKFEQIESDGSFSLTGVFSVKDSVEKISGISDKIRSYTLVSNGNEDAIIVRYVK